MLNRSLLLPALALTLALSTPAAELAAKKGMTLEVAKQVAAAAESHAKKNGWNVVIAVLDDGGHLQYLQRMDDTQVGSVEVALRKAESAFKFRRPSKVFSDGVGSRVQIVSLPGALAFEGGLPIVWEGQVVGAIGVSGVTAEQDGMIAQAGVDALASILE